MMLNLFKEYKLAFIATFSSLFLLFLYTSFYPNMDEAIHHHVLACTKYSLSSLHTYTEPCNGNFDLKLFGTWLPIRSFHYAGGLLSYILFNPLHSIINHYTVLFLYHFLLFCGIVFLTHKLLKVNLWLVLVIFSTCFPFYYQIIHDTGPVSYHILTFVLFPYLIWKTYFSNSNIQKILYIVLSGIVIFLAIEQKPFYIVLMPIPYLFTLVHFYYERIIDKKLFFYFSISFTITFILTCILLNAETKSGLKYYVFIKNMNTSIDVGIVQNIIDFLYRIKAYLKYLIFLPKFTHRLFYTYPTVLDIILSIAYWVFIVSIIFITKKNINNKDLKSYNFYLFILFLLTSILVCVPKSVWAGHHFVFPIFFILLILILLLDKLKDTKIVYLVILISFSISVYSILSHKNTTWLGDSRDYNTYTKFTDLSREDILENILTKEIQSKNIIVHIDWGTYYIDALFGPKDQSVMFIFKEEFILEPRQKILEKIDQMCLEIQQKAKNNHRGIIFVGLDSNQEIWNIIKQIFPNGKYLKERQGQPWLAYQGM